MTSDLMFDPVLYKVCSGCKVPVLRTLFSRRATADDGLQAQCKTCIANYHVARKQPGWKSSYDPNPKPAVAKQREAARELRASYAKAKAAGLVPPCPATCECCGRPPTAGKRLHWDHDHKTSESRGWLCGGCNTALGQLDEDPEIIFSLLLYVEAHRAGYLSRVNGGPTDDPLPPPPIDIQDERRRRVAQGRLQ